MSFLSNALILYAKFWFITVPLSFVTFFFVIFLIALLKDRGKSACLYFDTDKTCKLVFRKVEPLGTITIEDKKFMVARSRPTIFHRKFRIFPLYILKHDTAKPIDIVKTAEEQEESQREGEEKILPTTLNDFMNMTTLKSLLSIQSEDRKGLILFIFIGFIIGFLLAFVLFSMGVIKLKGG